MGWPFEGVISFAYDPGVADGALPALLGSPEYASHLTLLFGASFPSQNFCLGADCCSPVWIAGGALRNTGMLLPVRDAASYFLRFSSIGDTSRIERNLLGAPSVARYRSGSGELGGDMSS